MNALDSLHHSGRLPFSPGFRRHAGMAGRSDVGDKKHREGFLAMACMQSYPLRVNGCEVTQNNRGQWVLGLAAPIHIQAESKSDSQRGCSASISLPVASTLPTDFIMIPPTSCYPSVSTET